MPRVALILFLIAFPADAARRRAVTHPCPALPNAPASTRYALRFDQLGYLPSGAKWAVVMSDGAASPRFRVHDAKTQCVVAEGGAGPRVLDTRSRAGSRLTADRIELSSLGEGSYVVVLEDGSRFGPLRVANGVYDGVTPLLLTFLRTQRCGQTAFNHGACHLFSSVVDGDPATVSGDGVAVDYGERGLISSASGRNVDVEGGWHDAGDYLKFAGTSSFVVVMHLAAMRDHGNEQLREEVRWGLDWLYKMLAGDEAYLQVGGAGDHGRTRRPEADTFDPLPEYRQRPAVRFRRGYGRNLYGRGAAAFAMAASIFPEDAAKFRAAAIKLYTYGRAEFRPQPTDPARWYGEDSADDDLALAAAQLYRLTGDVAYRVDAFEYARRMTTEERGLTWNDLGALALSETALLFSANSRERAELAAQLASIVASVEQSYRAPRGPAAAFRYALPEMGNGSTARTLGAAGACLASARVNGDGDCVEVARTQLHWLFGQNPFGVSFMIGAGTSWPRAPHHNLWLTSRVQLDGAIVGGPAAAEDFDELPPANDPFARWSTAEVLYTDDANNYVTNEPAIDMLATLPWILGELTRRERTSGASPP